MRTGRRNLSAFLVLISLPLGASAAVIDILVVFDQASFGAQGNRSGDAAALVSSANLSLQNTGLGAHSFNLKYTHTLAPVEFNSATTPNSQAAVEFAYVSFEVDQLREQHAADVVVMVVEHTEPHPGGQICGRAQRPPTIFIHNRDTHYVAVILRNCIGVPHVPAHELAHIIGAEHEVGQGPDQDTNSSAPYAYNHPFVDADRDVATIMVSNPAVCSPGNCSVQNFFSNPGQSYGSPPIFLGNTSANNTAFIGGAFAVVAAYRPLPGPPPPATPTCAIEYMGCISGRRRWLISWFQNGATAPFSVGDADVSTNGGSSWLNFADTTDQCAPATPASPWIIRARIRSSYGDSSYCTITIPLDPCDDGEMD